MLATSVFVPSVLLRRKKKTKKDIVVKDNIDLFFIHFFFVMSLILERSTERNSFRKVSFNAERGIVWVFVFIN